MPIKVSVFLVISLVWVMESQAVLTSQIGMFTQAPELFPEGHPLGNQAPAPQFPRALGHRKSLSFWEERSGREKGGHDRWAFPSKVLKHNKIK